MENSLCIINQIIDNDDQLIYLFIQLFIETQY
jgi:hypothetical protein